MRSVIEFILPGSGRSLGPSGYSPTPCPTASSWWLSAACRDLLSSEINRRRPALRGDGTLLAPWLWAWPPNLGRFKTFPASPFLLALPPIMDAPDLFADVGRARPWWFDPDTLHALVRLPPIPLPLRIFEPSRKCRFGPWLPGDIGLKVECNFF